MLQNSSGETLTFSKLALIGGLHVQLSSAVLGNTQQRPH